MNVNIYRIILILSIILVLFGVIFNFSSQNGEKSGKLSKQITIAITKNIKYIQNLDSKEKEQVLRKVEHIVRKTAHFSIYALLGLLLMSLMKTYKLKEIKRIGISFIMGAVYAISDEIHQSFVPGRGPMVQDVLIDSLGVIFGILICIAICKIIKMIKGKRKENN